MFMKGISKGERGNLGPYFILFTIITSFANSVFSIDELGILYIPSISNLIEAKINKINMVEVTVLKTYLKNLFLEVFIKCLDFL